MTVNWISGGSAFGAAFARARPLTASQVTQGGVVSRRTDSADVKEALAGLRKELQKTLGAASPANAAPRPVYATRDLYEDAVVIGTHEILVGFESSEPAAQPRVAKDEIARLTSVLSGLQEGIDASPAQGGRLSIDLAGIVQSLDLNRLAADSSAAAIADAIRQVDRALAQMEPLQMKLEKQKQPAAVEPASYGLGDLDAHLDPPHTADAALALTRSVADRLRGIAGPTGLAGRASNSVLSIKS